jgi:hypothetical protein
MKAAHWAAFSIIENLAGGRIVSCSKLRVRSGSFIGTSYSGPHLADGGRTSTSHNPEPDQARRCSFRRAFLVGPLYPERTLCSRRCQCGRVCSHSQRKGPWMGLRCPGRTRPCSFPRRRVCFSPISRNASLVSCAARKSHGHKRWSACACWRRAAVTPPSAAPAAYLL